MSETLLIVNSSKRLAPKQLFTGRSTVVPSMMLSYSHIPHNRPTNPRDPLNQRQPLAASQFAEENSSLTSKHFNLQPLALRTTRPTNSPAALQLTIITSP
jgi:hypothetical protein